MIFGVQCFKSEILDRSIDIRLGIIQYNVQTFVFLILWFVVKIIYFYLNCIDVYSINYRMIWLGLLCI